MFHEDALDGITVRTNVLIFKTQWYNPNAIPYCAEVGGLFILKQKLTTPPALQKQSHLPLHSGGMHHLIRVLQSKTHLLLKEKALVIVRLFVVVN